MGISPGHLKLIVGLGNPGIKYHQTRHNVGFMVLEEIARLHNSNFKENKKIFGKTCQIRTSLNQRRLLMPTTYMNESGKSVRAAKDWFGIEPNQLLVIVDDMDLPLGKLRVRSKGSSGGHNGLRSVISHLGTSEFARLKIGIGAPSKINNERKTKTISHVLGKFSTQEFVLLKYLIQEIISGIELIKSNDWEKAITRLNSYKTEHL
tara:strand:- start:1601 stop:2218 length:618 start_codon:yes stop_codon:yes gene_type:complete